jgi:poly(3-hydroxybutyrate) depolymerase
MKESYQKHIKIICLAFILLVILGSFGQSDEKSSLRIRLDINKPENIGLQLNELCVTKTQKNSVADKMGIKPNDIITHCDNMEVAIWQALLEALRTQPYQSEFIFTVRRKSMLAEEYTAKLKCNLLAGQKIKFARFSQEIYIPLDIGLLLEGDKLDIISVINGSPAAGRMKPGDRIEWFQGKQVNSWEDIRLVIEEMPFTTTFSFKLERKSESGQKAINIRLELSKLKFPTSVGEGGKSGKIEKEITVDGTVRKYVLYVPTSASKGKPVPLVILLHGTNSHPDYMLFHWQPIIRDEAILAAPWGNRNWSYENDEAHKNDDKFILQMLEEIKEKYNINLSQIYISGHSCGGFYTYYWGVTYGNIFAAAGIFAGADHKAAKPSKRKCPFIICHNELDESVPFSAGRYAETILKGMGHIVEFIEDKDGIADPSHHEMNRQGVEAVWNFFKKHTLLDN